MNLSRNLIIASGVIVFHVAALWTLQSGLLKRTVELIVPAQIIVEFIEPPASQVAPPQPVLAPPLPKPTPVRLAPARMPAAVKKIVPPAPLPLAIADPTPSANASAGALASVVAPSAAPPLAEPIATPPAAAVRPAPPSMVLPSSDAQYLQNPKPAYPSLSKRLGEQGRVVIRVFIEADGSAKRAEIKQSSGFDRLDQAALITVLRWRYVSGKKAGVAEAMWFNVPISFVLE
ncbi:MAG: protein TonB [Rhodoferax sp.]|jgi:protein TonB